MAEKIIFSKRITSWELHHLVEKHIGVTAANVEVSGDRLNLWFEPPLTQEQRQVLDQRLSKAGYYLLEEKEPEEPHERN